MGGIIETTDEECSIVSLFSPHLLLPETSGRWVSLFYMVSVILSFRSYKPFAEMVIYLDSDWSAAILMFQNKKSKIGRQE